MGKTAVDKLLDIRAMTADSSAKQDAIARRVEGILDYLFWREGSAKQDVMAWPTAPG